MKGGSYMGIIISLNELNEARKRKAGKLEVNLLNLEPQHDFNFFIKRGVEILKKETEPGLIPRITGEDAQKEIESRILKVIWQKNLMGISYFLCALYVAKMIWDFSSKTPESWCAIDYYNIDDPQAMKNGGDVCFLVNALFQERAEWRLMNGEYYRKMGESFYAQYYNLTEAEVAWHMSALFNQMVDITRKCFRV